MQKMSGNKKAKSKEEVRLNPRSAGIQHWETEISKVSWDSSWWIPGPIYCVIHCSWIGMVSSILAVNI